MKLREWKVNTKHQKRQSLEKITHEYQAKMIGNFEQVNDK